MPVDFSPFDPLEESAGSKKKKNDTRAQAAADSVKPAERVLIEIELHHPFVILPRNSLVQEALMADLGKIEITNAMGSQKKENHSAVWQVALHDMRLDSLSETGKILKFVDKVDGSAKLTFNDKISEASPSVPALCVDINLHEVRGCLSDAQYGLLLSVFGQNFSERIITDEPLVQDLGLSTLALPEDSNFTDNLENVLKTARKGSVGCLLNAVYNVEVGVVELLARIFKRQLPV